MLPVRPRRRSPASLLAGLWLALTVTTASALPAADRQEPPRVNADAKAIVEFQKRVEEYAPSTEQLESTLPPLPKESTPEQIEVHQIGLAQQLRRARIHAKPGDIFEKETRALFRRYLARAFAGPDAADLLASIMDENPGRIRLTINGPYPDSVPIPTVPPQRAPGVTQAAARARIPVCR